ncbi:MAG: FMN-binding glutamate synthase family protein [Bacteroidetes bacterium]|nr:MAG: FMN-binding glutamate synthase family protein [Bacteroidota bacterium]MBL1144462.1 FMN-binding glutamate synthase family protein [Bacteroidota bacterium]NOG57257.1 FMN-binding glutamate synthase family protein [Bacteroidota bacterium]
MNTRRTFAFAAIIVVSIILALSYLHHNFIWLLIIVLPLIVVGIVDIVQTRHTIRRNFPVIGNFRFILEKIRPEIMQYFVETDTEGRPINRLSRSLIYQRAKKEIDTTPFGTQLNVYQDGYEWLDHSIYALNNKDIEHHPRILVGEKTCKQPYSSSILNISAMSFGALSKNAVLAMNAGAKMGNFAHNTGEGGISPYHIEPGGDLIWQIGTGYFGCRKDDGSFCPDLFQKHASIDNVKMIEIKISQGAKPGHGGILPASKNTEEIAAIRHIPAHTDVHSPPGHSAFNNPEELLHFVQQLRDLSGGKPVGFKLCIGKKQEFNNICEAIISTGIIPDFIAVDGGEGGTGAAPTEFSDSLGMPLRDGLAFVVDTLRGYNLKKDIKVIASGKVFSGFDIVRMLSIGADMVSSARAMMMAIGCIQALQCNTNTCPVGVATQDKYLMKGLVVKDKSKRVANYHEETVKSFIDLMAASGISKPSNISRIHINRRIAMNKVLKYNEIYPEVEEGAYLNQF